MSGTFRSLRNRNYRIWAAGALASNVGTWMQRTAQDWLVLTVLTHHSAADVGIVTSLQFGPQLLFLPWTGSCADRFDRRTIIFITQAIMATLALTLGLLTVTGVVRLWEVYVVAFLLGATAAFDAPARQTFVAEIVGEDDLSNAVALNSTSFSAARLIGPATAGLIISAVGSGWVFLVNAMTYLPVIAALAALRVQDLHRSHRHGRGGTLAEGARYVWSRPELRIILVMLFLVVTFGVNFQIFISTMSVSVFHVGAGTFGGIMSVMAVGSISGALLAARRERPTIALLTVGSAVFGAGLAVAALMPDYRLFALALVVVGIAAQTVTTSSLSLVQLGADPSMRGRVVAILLAVSLGGTPLGAPMVGWVADHLGPRFGMGVGVIACLAAACIGATYLLAANRAETSETVALSGETR